MVRGFAPKVYSTELIGIPRLRGKRRADRRERAISRGAILARKRACWSLGSVLYRVAHLLRERNMLTLNSKFRHQSGSQDNFAAERNFKF